MFTLKSLVAMAAMAVLSSAAPAITARQSDGGSSYAVVTACYHPNFTGNCYQFGAKHNVCYNVREGFNDQISSIRNQNTVNFYCRWFEHPNCQGRSYANQNDAKLQDGDGYFDDRISSIRCEQTTGGPFDK